MGRLTGGTVICAMLWTAIGAPALADGRSAVVSDAVLDQPHDLTLSPDGAYLYVAEVGSNRIAVLDAASLAVLGSFGEEDLSGPRDVDFDTAGRLLVADTHNHRIAIYWVDGASGTLVGEMRGPINKPEGVEAAWDRTVLVTSASRQTVMKFSDGELLAEAGGAGDGPGRYASPHDIEMGPDGDIVVADTKNNRLQVLDSSLGFRRSLGPPAFPFRTPKFFSIDDRGWIYLADEVSDGVIVLDRDHTVRGFVAAAELNNPEGIVVFGEFMWIADTGNNRIVRYPRVIE